MRQALIQEIKCQYEDCPIFHYVNYVYKLICRNPCPKFAMIAFIHYA